MRHCHQLGGGEGSVGLGATSASAGAWVPPRDSGVSSLRLAGALDRCQTKKTTGMGDVARAQPTRGGWAPCFGWWRCRLRCPTLLRRGAACSAIADTTA